MQRSLEYEIGFADSEFVTYEKDDKASLRVRIRSWDNRLIDLTFTDCVYVVDNNIGDISDIVQVVDDTRVLNIALALVYDHVPAAHPFKHFRFVNVDDNACLEVIAHECAISPVGQTLA